MYIPFENTQKLQNSIIYWKKGKKLPEIKYKNNTL